MRQENQETVIDCSSSGGIVVGWWLLVLFSHTRMNRHFVLLTCRAIAEGGQSNDADSGTANGCPILFFGIEGSIDQATRLDGYTMRIRGLQISSGIENGIRIEGHFVGGAATSAGVVAVGCCGPLFYIVSYGRLFRIIRHVRPTDAKAALAVFVNDREQ